MWAKRGQMGWEVFGGLILILTSCNKTFKQKLPQ
jgi:hypothetical protein